MVVWGVYEDDGFACDEVKAVSMADEEVYLGDRVVVVLHGILYHADMHELVAAKCLMVPVRDGSANE